MALKVAYDIRVCVGIVHMLIYFQGIYSVISYHKHSVEQALMDIFRDVRFEKSKFWVKRKDYFAICIIIFTVTLL
jgi:hypothetical protein